MDTLKPVTRRRDDLLQDPRFWGQLYWFDLEARVGDAFHDGLDYFLGIGSQAANDLLDELEPPPVDDGYFPEASVTVPLRNGWRAGVILSCYPEDFEIQQVLVPPRRSPTVISVSGGTLYLPGLRWEELLTIADAVLPIPPASRERTLLLLYPSVFVTAGDFAEQARPVLSDCWQRVGFPIRHLDEFLDRLGAYDSTARWAWSEPFGWTNDGQGNPRNPASRRGPSVVPVVKEFFDSLALRR